MTDCAIRNNFHGYHRLCRNQCGIKKDFACLIFMVGGQTLKIMKFMLLKNLPLHDISYPILW